MNELYLKPFHIAIFGTILAQITGHQERDKGHDKEQGSALD